MYACARDLFDAARTAATECERTRRMLLAMEAAEQGGRASLDSKIARGSISDPMRRVDARIDREAAWRVRIEENESLMDYATCVLYGSEQDGKGGIAVLLGTAYADALWWYYLGHETWERTGEIVGYSKSRCKSMRDVAFDLVDALGLAATICGEGMATN